jgi:hypothetical protein
MSIEEELIELSQVVAAQKERVEELEQLIREYDEFLRHWLPSTYSQYGLLLKQRMAELDITSDRAVQHE